MEIQAFDNQRFSVIALLDVNEANKGLITWHNFKISVIE